MSEARVLTCEEALRFLAAYLDGELQGTGEQDVQDHLARCRSCFSRAEFEKQLKQRVGALGRTEIRPEFAERVRGLLDGFTKPKD